LTQVHKPPANLGHPRWCRDAGSAEGLFCRAILCRS
jgi:hypothetical protein